jgi:hypothetical protein
MSISGFDLAQARYDGATPDVRELTDEVETKCLGTYPEQSVPAAVAGTWECEDRSTCYLCDGTVCAEHDSHEVCDGSVVHEACHDQGCYSAACAADARDDALMARDDADHGR